MISRSIFLTLICHHRQMHCSLGFILCCVHGRHDISSPLVKSYAFDLFAFFFCLLIHVCYNPHALFLFAQLFPKLISVGCLNLIEASPITICFSFVSLWFHDVDNSLFSHSINNTINLYNWQYWSSNNLRYCDYLKTSEPTSVFSITSS